MQNPILIQSELLKDNNGPKLIFSVKIYVSRYEISSLNMFHFYLGQEIFAFKSTLFKKNFFFQSERS